MHNVERIQRWMNIPSEELAKLSPERQAYILQAIESSGKKDWAASRRTELAAIAHSREQSPISKDLARGIVILLGCMTFSAASGQVAKQTQSGALVIPASLIGGVLGGILAHEMGSIVSTGLLLKSSTNQARRSLHRRN
jgi:hypothetical protein